MHLPFDMFGGAPTLTINIVALYTEAREACFPAFKVINRTKESNKENKPKDVEDSQSQMLFRRGDSELPPYVIDSSSEAGKKPESISGEISFNNVSFSYPTRKEVPVFTNLNLRIPSGKTVRYS